MINNPEIYYFPNKIYLTVYVYLHLDMYMYKE